VAACSAELVQTLHGDFDIDVFVDAAFTRPAPPSRSAHDFVWLNQQRPYDLIVYQMGNSAVHEYIWPYLFRYPGLAVLHDAHLHHARAAALLGAARKEDYRREFSANHPGASPDVAELAIAGFDTHLYYQWPMTRLVVARSRATAVHSPGLARCLREQVPGAAIEAINLGHGVELSAEQAAEGRRRMRNRYRIPEDAVVFGCFGGLSPEKRLPQVLAAFAATRAQVAGARLLLAGAAAQHYDLQRDVDRSGLAGSVVTTGYLESDEELTACIAAADVAVTLRWPTAREVSGPWLRCLAAGIPTITVQLAHLTHVPALDPRSWHPTLSIDNGSVQPVTVAVDILDEDHSLRLAMLRLARDRALGAELAAAARHYWRTHHAPEVMARDYRRLIALASERPAPLPSPVPPHLLHDGTAALRALMAPFGLPDPLR
jgi:glycosyltransferase involved in cell wall biosynthesis